MNQKTTNIIIFSVLALVLIFVIPLIAIIVIYAITTGIESSAGAINILTSLWGSEIESISELRA